MADDDRIVRLTFTIDGLGQFKADLTAAQAAAFTAGANIEGIQTRLSSVTQTEIRKRSTAHSQGAAAAINASNAETAAINKIVDATKLFPPATDRILTSGNRLQNFTALSKEFGDKVTANVTRAAKAVADAQAYVDRFTNIKAPTTADTEKAVQALVSLANAQTRYNKALADQKSVQTVTSTPALGGMSAVEKQANEILERQLNDQLEATKRLASQGLDQLISKYDAVAASAKRMSEEFAAVDVALEASLITDKEKVEWNDKIIASYGGLESALEKFQAAHGQNAPPVTTPQVTQANALISNMQASAAAGNPIDPAAIQESNELAAGLLRVAQATERFRDQLNPTIRFSQTLNDELSLIARSGLEAADRLALETQAYARFSASVANLPNNRAAQSLRDQIDPLATAFTKYGMAVAEADRLVASGSLISSDRDKAVKLAQYTFEAASASIRKNAVDTYAELKAASEGFQRAQAQGRGTPAVPTPQVTTANNLLNQIQPNTRTGELIDPRSSEEIQKLVTEFVTLTGSENEVAAATQRYKDQLNPLLPLSRSFQEEIAAINETQLSSVEKTELASRAYDRFTTSVSNLNKETQSVYASLKEANDAFDKAQGTGRATAGPPMPTSQQTNASAVLSQLQNNINNNQQASSAQLQSAQQIITQLKEMTAAQNDAAASAQKLRDEIDPVGAIYRKAAEDIAKYEAILGKTDITQEQFNAKKAQINTSAGIQASNVSGTTAAQADYERLAKAADAYRARLNPLIDAQQQYAVRINQIKEFQSVGLATDRQTEAELAKLTAGYDRVSKSLEVANKQQLSSSQISKTFKTDLQQASRDITDFSSTTTRAFGFNRVGFLELQAAGVNAFQSLAAGISPLRTIETEGAQVIGALIQGTNLTLKQFIAYAAPLAGVAAAFVAFGVAVASAAARAAEIRELNVALATFHQGTVTIAADLIKIQKEFARTGESTTTLQTALAALARNPNINIQATSNILEVARNVGAAFGTDITGGLEKLTTALDGGAQGIVGLGHQLGVLKDGQGGEILILEKTAGQQAAVKRGYDLIAASLRPYTESLGPAQQLGRAITGVWNQFIESIKESEPVQNALKYVQDLIDKLNNLKDALKTQNETGKGSESTSILSGVLHGAAIGGAAGAAIGGAAVSPGIVTIPLGIAAGGVGGTIVGGIAGGFGAVGLNTIGPRGRQGTIPDTSNISAMEALNPLSMFTPNPSLVAPTVGSYSTALVTDTSGRTGVSASLASTDRSIVSLGTGLRNTSDTLSRFNTTISTSISAEEKSIQTETNNYNNEVKGLDAVAASLDKLKNAADPLATTLASIKAPPSMIGGMETGGAVGGAVDSAGRVTFGNPFVNALAQLESGGRNISQRIIDSNTAKGTPGEGIFQITRPTAAQFSQGRYSSAFQLDAAGQAALAENIPLNRFGGRTQRGMQDQFGPLDTSKTIGELAQLTTGTAAYTTAVKDNAAAVKDNAATSAGPLAAADVRTLAARDAQDESLRTQTDLFKVVKPFLLEYGSALEADTQAATKQKEVQDATNDSVRAANAAQETRKEVIERATAARDKDITTATLENTTTTATTRALTQGLVPGYQAEAEATARLANLQEPLIDIRQRQNQEIQKTSSTVVRSGQEQIAATTPLLARQEALAMAAIKGAQAEHEQALVNQANAQSFDAITRATSAYNTAQTSGTEADKTRTKAALDLAQAQERSALAQVRAADVAAQVTEVGHTLQQNRDQAQVIALQASLQGQTTEEITKQATLLQSRQYISEHLNNISDKYKQSIIDSVTGVQNLNIALAETQRQQERVNQLFQGFGETISSTLGTAIENAFSGQKVKDWGAELNKVLAQALTQIIQFEFIRPVIGTALQAIGLSQAATNFGSIGALTGIGGIAGSGGAAGTIGGAASVGLGGAAVTPAIGVGGSVIGGGGALASAGGSIFGTGGFSGFLNNIGGKLGFASTTEIPIGQAITQGYGPLAANAAGNATVAVPGGLFGAATLGSVLSGAGIGFGAGAVLNTLRRGNVFGGTVGSGLGGIGGSLGGAVLGTTLFPGVGTALGAIIGGIAGGGGGGLLGGLFGNSQRSNAASGANVNIGAGGVVFGARSSGNQQNDQTVNQITTSVSQFTNTLLTLTKGVESATVNVQAGVRDGIRASIVGAAGTTNIRTKDPADAINQIELNIAKGLTNVSDTLKTVLANVTDPSQIQSAVTFAATYDDLKKAADNAFSSISTDVKTVGPFATALKSLNDTFASLTDQANQFGLSLDPINKGLAEATKRLRDDFGKALDQALNTANNSDFLNQLATVAQGFSSNVQEQQAIGLGGDVGTTSKINQLEIAQAQSLLSALTAAQLKQVEDAFQTTNPEIAAMAKALLDAGISADSATSSLNSTTNALKSFADGVKAVEDTLTQLHTGPLAGLTPQGQVSAAQSAFQGQLATVQAAGPNVTGDQLTQLASLAQTTIQTAQTVFGNAPQTSDLRNLVINTLNTVLTTTGASAAATTASAAEAKTPAQAAIQASPVVASAQSAAVTAALHAAGVPGFAMGVMNESMMPAVSMGYAKGDPAMDTNSQSKGTPSGTILVGEKGPEWMLPKGGDWTQVGKSGPELINQPGGAIILPNPLSPERAFAEGVGVGDVLGQAPGIGSLISQAAGGPSLLEAAGGAAGLASDTISAIGDVLPIAGPLVGGLLGVATGHPVQGAIGAAASLLGFAVGGPIGGVIGGLIGLLGNAIGPKPSNNASGDLIDLATGEISGFQSAGDKRADATVAQISAGISNITKTFQAATGGTISGAVNVQDGKRDGIKTSYSGPLGHVDAKWRSVEDATDQFALAIAHDLVGLSPELQAQLSGTSDPNALISIIQGVTGAFIDLNSGTVVFPPTGGINARAPNTTAATVEAPVVVPPPPPTLQQMYDSVVGGDTTNFNNDAGLQNKVNLVSLLSLYGRLTQDQKTNYNNTIQTNTTTWNNTPTGIINKLGLVRTIVGGTNIDTTPSIDNLMQQYSALPAYAMGSRGGTPPGKILVGERGPEWIHTGNVVSMETYRQTLPNMAGWSLVGRNGPEVIEQKGGATILPFPKTPWEVAGRAFVDGAGAMPVADEMLQGAFADGTGTMPEVTFTTPREPSPGQNHSRNEMQEANIALLKKLGDIQAEMVALRRVTQGGQVDASTTAKTSNKHLGDINRKTAPAIVGPRRQKFG